MKELHTDIVLKGTSVDVWAELLDFESYPRWNPFIRSIEGNSSLGSQLKVRIQPSGSIGLTMKPKVTLNDQNHRFGWLGHLLIRGLFDGRHEFLIEASGEGKVRFIQREEFSGILVPLLWPMISRNTRRGFEEMNLALKARIEGNN